MSYGFIKHTLNHSFMNFLQGQSHFSDVVTANMIAGNDMATKFLRLKIFPCFICGIGDNVMQNDKTRSDILQDDGRPRKLHHRLKWSTENSWCTTLAHIHSTIDQSHKYGRHQAACREPAGSYDKTTRTAICFEHKTQYPLIRAPYTRIAVFWHISNIPPMISQSN